METDFRALAHRFEPAELFYKELAEKQAAGGEEYKLYLESLSKDDLIRQGLVVPDLFPPYRRYPEYRSIFPENGDIAVWKHSRYTPVYMHTHEYFEITGYGSEEHFIRQFRKYKGMTPSGYRKNNTGN